MKNTFQLLGEIVAKSCTDEYTITPVGDVFVINSKCGLYTVTPYKSLQAAMKKVTEYIATDAAEYDFEQRRQAC